MLAIARRALAPALLAAALGGAACSTADVYFSREGGTEEQFNRSSQSCTDMAAARVEEEAERPLLEQGGRTTGPGLDAKTDPNRRNDQRRRARRVRYFYQECMEARGWIPNEEGQGFKGL